MSDPLSKELELLYSQVCHALGDPKRLRILYALAQQPCYVGELVEALDLPQSTVSRHLKILRERNLVTTQREGTAVHYALRDERIIQALDLMRTMLRDTMRQQADIAEFIALETTRAH